MKTKILKHHGSFDSLYYLLCGLFDKIKDHRDENASYALSDLLKMGFAMFSLKSPSLLNFVGRTKAEDSNLGSIYKIGALASENGLRKGLDRVSPDGLRVGFQLLWKRIKGLGILERYRYLGRYLTVSIDGVEHFCSGSIHCDHCLARKKKNGRKDYHHAMLSAVLVHPTEKEVFVMDNEPIVRQDGTGKNDCERNAAGRLLGRMQGGHGDVYFS